MLSFFFLVMTNLSFANEVTRHWVVITDSHGVGKFGEELTRHIKSAGPLSGYDFIASGASAPLQWQNNLFTTTCGYRESSQAAAKARACYKLFTPSLKNVWAEQDIQESSQRVTIIVLGTNFSTKPSRFEEHVKETVGLMEVAYKMSNKCFWVGPPNMTRAPDFDVKAVEHRYSIIKRALRDLRTKGIAQTCQLIDSRLISTYPKVGGDGIHYHWPWQKNIETIQAATNWANGVIEVINSKLIKHYE
ncbi:MAG: hypothetical protein JNM93_06080 [Bacteriovoracaceae bacterium]|nr:hypothetical protein [Bacteriovoracaceae bacterium]